MAESLPSTQPSIAARMAIAVGTCSIGASSAAAAWGAWPALAAAYEHIQDTGFGQWR